jgi:hypothetical protein
VELSHAIVKELYDKYFGADKSFSQYNINLPDGVNNLDPLIMLELINGENTVTQRAAITTQLIVGKKVEIYEGEKKIKGFTHNGTGSISLLFTDDPYLLQVLIDYGYALVLKKLTPPSPVSNVEVAVGQ